MPSVARNIPESRPGLTKVGQAAKDLRELRDEMVRRGFKPLTDEEIKHSIAEGRP